MKFKVLKGTETFSKLDALKDKVISVRMAAIKAVESLGSTRHCKRASVLAGGVAALHFEEKPEGYKIIDAQRKLYFPKASKKKDYEMLWNLPTVTYSELNDIIGFKGGQVVERDDKSYWISTVGWNWGKEEMLIETESGCKYTPNSDMIEILESEWYALEEKHKSEDKQ